MNKKREKIILNPMKFSIMPIKSIIKSRSMCFSTDSLVEKRSKL